MANALKSAGYNDFQFSKSGYDLQNLVIDKKLSMSYIHIYKKICIKGAKSYVTEQTFNDLSAGEFPFSS